MKNMNIVKVRYDFKKQSFFALMPNGQCIPAQTNIIIKNNCDVSEHPTTCTVEFLCEFDPTPFDREKDMENEKAK